jgi:hypothetical protein
VNTNKANTGQGHIAFTSDTTITTEELSGDRRHRGEASEEECQTDPPPRAI